ncbi:MAG: ethylbenzene dehydrogenase-related protein [Thiobacillus sp.]
MKRIGFGKRLSWFALCFAVAGLGGTALAAVQGAQSADAKVLRVLSVKGGADARSPDAAIWKKAPMARVDLQPAFPGHSSIVGTPATGQLTAQAVRVRDMLYVKLRWNDKTANTAVTDTDRFLDRVAVQFPLNGEASTLPFMGDGKHAVNIWHWRADGRTENLFAKGFGTVTPVFSHVLTSAAARHGDAWEVVLARPLAAKQEEGVMLKGRKTIPIAFAVWDGNNQERDGLKAVTLEWWQLRF